MFSDEWDRYGNRDLVFSKSYCNCGRKYVLNSLLTTLDFISHIFVPRKSFEIHNKWIISLGTELLNVVAILFSVELRFFCKALFILKFH